MNAISIKYRKNEIEEHLVSLYLRLNGYFTSGFIVHSGRKGNVRGEVDILATRFPFNREPEREVGTCPKLSVPANLVDFIIGEVKNKKEAPRFNPSMFEEDNLEYQLRWMGAIAAEQEIKYVASQLIAQLNNKADGFPCVQFPQNQPRYQVRLVLFDLNPEHQPDPRCISGADVINHLWKCLRTDVRPPSCARRYNYEAWGALYSPMVKYFKDQRRKTQPASVNDLISQMLSVK